MFQAYKSYLKAQGIEREPSLPGIDMSPDKTFFLSNAQVYTCQKN